MSSAAEPLARDVVRDPSAGLGALLDRFAGALGTRYAGLGGATIGENGALTAALDARWSLPMGNTGLEVHGAGDLAALARDWGTYEGYDAASFDFSGPFVRPVDPAAHPTGLSAQQVGYSRGPSRSLVSTSGARVNAARPQPREQWRAAADGRLSPYPASMGTPGGIAPSLLRFPDARGALMAPMATAAVAGGPIARPAGTRNGSARTVLVSDAPGRAWGGHPGAATAATAAERMADGIEARHADTQAERPALWLVPRGTTGTERRRLAEVGGVRRGATAGLAAAIALTDRLGERVRVSEDAGLGFGPGDIGTLVQPRVAAAPADLAAASASTVVAGRLTTQRASMAPERGTRPAGLVATASQRAASVSLAARQQFSPANLRTLGEAPATSARATEAGPWQVPGAGALAAAWQALGRNAVAAAPGAGRGVGPTAAMRAAAAFDTGAPGALVRARGAATPEAPNAGPARGLTSPRSAASPLAAAPRAVSPLARAVSRGPGAAADPVGAGAPLGHRVAARALAHATDGVGGLLAALPAAREFGAPDPARSGGIVSALLTRLATASQAEARGLRAARAPAAADPGFAFDGPLDAEWVRGVAQAPLPGPAASADGRAQRGPAREAAARSVAASAPARALTVPPAAGAAVAAGTPAAAVARWLPLLTEAGRNAARSVIDGAPVVAERAEARAPLADAPLSRAVSLRAGLSDAPLATEAFAARLSAERFESPSALLAAEAPTAMDLAMTSPEGALVVPVRWTPAGAQFEPGTAPASPQARRALAASTHAVAQEQRAQAAANRSMAKATATATATAARVGDTTAAARPAQAKANAGATRARPLPEAADAGLLAGSLRPAPAGRAARSATAFAARRLAVEGESTGARGAAAARRGGRTVDPFAGLTPELPGAIVSPDRTRAGAAASMRGTQTEVVSGAPRLTGATPLTSGLLAAFAEADRGRTGATRPAAAPLGAEVRAAAAGQALIEGRRPGADLGEAPGALVSAAPGRPRSAPMDAPSVSAAPAGRATISTRPGLTAATASALAERLTQARSRVFEAAARAVTARAPSIASASAASTRAAANATAVRSGGRTASLSPELPGAVVASARLDRPAGQAGVVAPNRSVRPTAGSGLSDARSLVARLLGPEAEVAGGLASAHFGLDVSPGTLVAAAGVRAGNTAGSMAAAAGAGGGESSVGGSRSSRRLGYAPGNVGRALVAFNRAARVEAARGGNAGAAAVAARLGVDSGFFASAGELLNAAVDAPRPASAMARRAEPAKVRPSMRLPGSLFADRGPSISVGSHEGGAARVMVDTGARAAEQALRSTPGQRPERKAETNEEARHRNAEQSEDSLSPEEVERIARDVIARLEKEAEADRDLFGEDFD